MMIQFLVGLLVGVFAGVAATLWGLAIAGRKMMSGFDTARRPK